MYANIFFYVWFASGRGRAVMDSLSSADEHRTQIIRTYSEVRCVSPHRAMDVIEYVYERGTFTYWEMPTLRHVERADLPWAIHHCGTCVNHSNEATTAERQCLWGIRSVSLGSSISTYMTDTLSRIVLICLWPTVFNPCTVRVYLIFCMHRASNIVYERAIKAFFPIQLIF